MCLIIYRLFELSAKIVRVAKASLHILEACPPQSVTDSYNCSRYSVAVSYLDVDGIKDR